MSNSVSNWFLHPLRSYEQRMDTLDLQQLKKEHLIMNVVDKVAKVALVAAAVALAVIGIYSCFVSSFVFAFGLATIGLGALLAAGAAWYTSYRIAHYVTHQNTPFFEIINRRYQENQLAAQIV